MGATPKIQVNSLQEVRESIDLIDRDIVRLLGQRCGFVKEAARFKFSKSDVEASARVEAVIDKVRALAIEHALSPNIAETTYRAMISAFIEMEHAEVERARSQPK